MAYITYIIVFLIIIVVTILALYVFSTYFSPKKLDEIAELIKKGQFKSAIRKLDEILAADDRNVYAHFLLGEAYRMDKNFQYAILEYRQVIKLGLYSEKVNEVDVRDKLATLYKNQNKINDAKKEYMILTQIDPNNYQNYYWLGYLFFTAGVFDKALDYFKKAASLNQTQADIFYYLGQIQYRTGNTKDAKQAFMNTIKLDSANSKAHYFLGLALRAEGDVEWAVKEFEIAQKSEDIRSKCFLAKGSCYLEIEHYPKAIIEFDKGLRTARKGSDTELNMRYFLASAHEKMRDLQSAIEHWEKIYEQKKNFRDVEQKLRQNAEFRQDDRIKDFMIASLSNFEHLSRKMIESMNFEVQELKVLKDSEIEIYAVEKEDNRRNTRRVYRIIRVYRTTNVISDGYLRNLYDMMKPKNAQRVMVISTGEFGQSAIDYSNTRPIELITKSKLIELLKKVS
ncbi:MAG: tetratricopeptide repeat protein [Spirochaetes bacterium]|jgi:tetratricopeptide (TPR) repeat protein|nr:tetratricopeptide repeat protein [Spirochaetota bacterium]